MNNKSLKWAAALTAALGISLAGAAASFADAPVTPERAKEIALNHAGVSAENARHLKVRSDYDDGREVYEVEFYAGGNEYDYDIAKADGDIVKFDKDKKHSRRHSALAPAASAGGISLDDAAAKALARVPGANRSDLRIHRDRDDGRPTYEGDIYYGGYEYDFEIDAATGEFIQWERDRA